MPALRVVGVHAEVVGGGEQRDLLALLGQPESGEHRRLAVPEDGDLARLGAVRALSIAAASTAPVDAADRSGQAK